MRRLVDTQLSLTTTDYRLKAVIPGLYDDVGGFSFTTTQRLLFKCIDQTDCGEVPTIACQIETGSLSVDRSPFVGTARYDWKDGSTSPTPRVGSAGEVAGSGEVTTTDIAAVSSDQSSELALVDWFHKGGRRSVELEGSHLLAPVAAPSGLSFNIFSGQDLSGSGMRIAAPLVPYTQDISAMFSQMQGTVPIRWIDRTDYIDRFAGEGVLTLDLSPVEYFRPTVESLLRSGRNLQYAHNANIQLKVRIAYEWNVAENRLESVQLEGDVAIDESWHVSVDFPNRNGRGFTGVVADAEGTWTSNLTSTLLNAVVWE